jgi:hypothetical protein
MEPMKKINSYRKYDKGKKTSARFLILGQLPAAIFTPSPRQPRMRLCGGAR